MENSKIQIFTLMGMGKKSNIKLGDVILITDIYRYYYPLKFEEIKKIIKDQNQLSQYSDICDFNDVFLDMFVDVDSMDYNDEDHDEDYDGDLDDKIKKQMEIRDIKSNKQSDMVISLLEMKFLDIISNNIIDCFISMIENEEESFEFKIIITNALIKLMYEGFEMEKCLKRIFDILKSWLTYQKIYGIDSRIACDEYEEIIIVLSYT